jgi:hypothetical protein
MQRRKKRFVSDLGKTGFSEKTSEKTTEEYPENFRDILGWKGLRKLFRTHTTSGL